MNLYEIGQILHQKRREKGKRLKDIQEATGMHYANLSQIERGQRSQLRFKTLQRYCKALDLEIIVRDRHDS